MLTFAQYTQKHASLQPKAHPKVIAQATAARLLPEGYDPENPPSPIELAFRSSQAIVAIDKLIQSDPQSSPSVKRLSMQNVQSHLITLIAVLGPDYRPGQDTE